MSGQNSTAAAGEILRLDKLSIQFGGLKAVDQLSFTVKEKEIFGLIGPNGAGKTTAFNCITQFYTPTSGDVYFTDKSGQSVNLVGKPVHKIISMGLVRTFQNVEVIKELSLLDNVLIGAHIDFRATVLEQALRLPRARREEREYRQKAQEMLDFMGVGALSEQLAGGQPYGVLKKVEMARTLMANPRLIILDEPAAGLNDTETAELATTIHQIRDKFNCTILLVEHDMRLVMGICDRICAISFGKFLACGTPAEIQQDKQVQEAYLGEEDGDNG